MFNLQLHICYKTLLVYINFSFDFAPKIIPISRIFDEYIYIHSYYKYFTILVSVLYQTYSLSPSARVCLSDTTWPLIL